MTAPFTMQTAVSQGGTAGRARACQSSARSNPCSRSVKSASSSQRLLTLLGGPYTRACQPAADNIKPCRRASAIYSIPIVSLRRRISRENAGSVPLRKAWLCLHEEGPRPVGGVARTPRTLPSSVTTVSRQPPEGEQPDGDQVTERTVARRLRCCAVLVAACSRRQASWKCRLLEASSGLASTSKGDS